MEALKNETLEGDGQINSSMSMLETTWTEKEQVQAVWDATGVDKSRYLAEDELATVCEYIGMEEMESEIEFKM